MKNLTKRLLSFFLGVVIASVSPLSAFAETGLLQNSGKEVVSQSGYTIYGDANFEAAGATFTTILGNNGDISVEFQKIPVAKDVYYSVDNFFPTKVPQPLSLPKLTDGKKSTVVFSLKADPSYNYIISTSSEWINQKAEYSVSIDTSGYFIITTKNVRVDLEVHYSLDGGKEIEALDNGTIRLPKILSGKSCNVMLSLEKRNVEVIKPKPQKVDYTYGVDFAPKYVLKYNSGRAFGGESWVPVTRNDQISVWINGANLKLSGRKTYDYKTETLFPSIQNGLKDGRDKDYTDVNIKGAYKNEKIKFQWVVTSTDIVNPITALTSKSVQALGKDIATCAGGKLTANAKQQKPTAGRLWAFDANGDYGYCDFTVEIACNKLFATNIRNVTEFDQNKGKPNSDINVSTLDLALGDESAVFVYPSSGTSILSGGVYGYKSARYSVEIAPGERNKSCISLREIVNQDGSLAGVWVKGEALVGGKPATVKINLTAVESQKTVSFTVKVSNPIRDIEVMPPSFPSTLGEVVKTVDVYVDFNTDNRVTDENLTAYVVTDEYSTEDFSSNGKKVTVPKGALLKDWKVALTKNASGNYTATITKTAKYVVPEGISGYGLLLVASPDCYMVADGLVGINFDEPAETEAVKKH